jgi:hypothetical protein
MPGNAAILATRQQVAQPSAMTGSAKRNVPVSRQQRLSAALRENLKRRKTQAKDRKAERTAGEVAEGGREPHDSAGIVVDKRTD